LVNDDDNTSAGNGELSKFRERLERYKRSRNKGKVNKENNQVKGSKKVVSVLDIKTKKVEKIDVDKLKANVDKVSYVKVRPKGIGKEDNVKKSTDVKALDKKEVKKEKVLVEDKARVSVGIGTNKVLESKSEEKKSLDNKELDVKKKVEEQDNVKKVPKKRQSKCVGIIKRKDISNLTGEEKLKRLDELEKKILLELDTKLRREIDELNGITREQNDIVDFLDNQKLISQEEVEEKLKRLNELLEKINKLIEQVKILNDNYRFEDVLNITDFQDQNIVNDIIEFRDILDTSKHSEKLTEKYKMLDKFILLYREVYIKEDVVKNNISVTEKQLEETKDRDNKYLRTREDIDNIERVNKDCKLIIDKQNEYLVALNRRISHIDSSRVLEYRMTGTNNLLMSTLMYIGIMMAMPFRNRRNQNMARILLTGQMLRNFNRNKLRPFEKIKYEAVDLTSEIYSHLDEVDIVSSVVNSTLDEVRSIKSEFKREFKGKVPGYEEVEAKLLEVERMVLASKKQLERTEDSLNRSLRENNKKLVRVKELNQNVA
jgi:hypothetical protein